jgi:hypothetical protein
MEVGISYLGWCDPAGVTIQSSSILGKWQYLFRISIHKPALRVPHLLSELIHLLSELMYLPLGFARGAAVHIMCCLSNGAWPQRGQISITMPPKKNTLVKKNRWLQLVITGIECHHNDGLWRWRYNWYSAIIPILSLSILTLRDFSYYIINSIVTVFITTNHSSNHLIVTVTMVKLGFIQPIIISSSYRFFLFR